MTTITVPKLRDERIARLVEVGEISTATEWERALLVAVDVRLDTNGGTGAAVRSDSLSPSQFAAFGIVGLRSTNTVRRYVQAWLDAHDGKYPSPGRRKLPDTPWGEVASRTVGGASVESVTRTPGSVAAALADADFREKVIDRLPASTNADLIETISIRESNRPEPVPTPVDDMIRDPFAELRRRIVKVGQMADQITSEVSTLADPVAAEDCASAVQTARSRLALLVAAFDSVYGDPIDEIAAYANEVRS